MVRQDNVKEESRINDQRSPNKRTFVEAKQILPEYDDMNQMIQMGQMNQMNHMNQMNAYNDSMYNSENTFREADEDETFDSQQQYQPNYYQAMSEPRLQYDEDEMSHQMRHSENYMPDTTQQYSSPEQDGSWYGRKERPYRRRSREFVESEVMVSHEDEHRRKPETMRSISEDTPTRTAKQAVTRRTLSHPEKDTHSQVASTIIYNNHINVARRDWPYN